MVNPQKENGFTGVANELWDEVLRRDFTKRQINMILLIWRLSYGCNQKDCKIETFNTFELVGLYKADIKKELKYLRECHVIDWSEETMVFSIDKNYEKWQISPAKNFEKEKLKEVIALNLKRKKVSKTLTGEGQEVSKILTDEENVVSKTLTSEGQAVSKTLTGELVKHLPEQASIPTAPSDSSAVKTLLNTINNKDNNNIKDTERIINFWDENNFGLNNIFAKSQILMYLDDGFESDVIIRALEIACEREARNLNYVKKILNNWEERGAKTIEAVKALQEMYESSKQKRTEKGNSENGKNQDAQDWLKKYNIPF